MKQEEEDKSIEETSEWAQEPIKWMPITALWLK